MNIENIKRVRDHIAALPAKKFAIREPALTSDGCGCIAAHAYAALGGSAETNFGIDREEFGRLIMPEGWQIYPGKFTRDGAVRVLDHLMATGAVDWSVAKRVTK